MAANKGGRNATYTLQQVRFALEKIFAERGRVPTDVAQIPASDVLPILTSIFDISPTVRPESLQKVIDELFDEYVDRQRQDDRARLPARQKDRIGGLMTAFENAIIDGFTVENDFLARAQFETMRTADSEKDAVRQELFRVKEALALALDEKVELSAEIDRCKQVVAVQSAELMELKLKIAHLEGQVTAYAGRRRDAEVEA